MCRYHLLDPILRSRYTDIVGMNEKFFTVLRKRRFIPGRRNNGSCVLCLQWFSVNSITPVWYTFRSENPTEEKGSQVSLIPTLRRHPFLPLL